MKKVICIITAAACIASLSACTIQIGDTSSTPASSSQASSASSSSSVDTSGNTNSQSQGTANFRVTLETDDEQFGGTYYYLQFPEIEAVLDDIYDMANDSIEREAYRLANEVINENGGGTGTITSVCEISSYTDTNVTAKETYTYTPQGGTKVVSEKTLSVTF